MQGWDREHGFLAKLEGGILVGSSGKGAEEAKDVVWMLGLGQQNLVLRLKL